MGRARPRALPVARSDRSRARRVSRHLHAAAARVFGEEDRRRAQLQAGAAARRPAESRSMLQPACRPTSVRVTSTGSTSSASTATASRCASTAPLASTCGRWRTTSASDSGPARTCSAAADAQRRLRRWPTRFAARRPGSRSRRAVARDRPAGRMLPAVRRSSLTADGRPRGPLTGGTSDRRTSSATPSPDAPSARWFGLLDPDGRSDRRSPQPHDRAGAFASLRCPGVTFDLVRLTEFSAYGASGSRRQSVLLGPLVEDRPAWR